jgi:hypothetical protein
MDKPSTVYQAETMIWMTLLVSAAISLIDLKSGTVGQGRFMADLFVYGLLCIIPYKIGRGSNAARYVFTIMSVIGFLMMLGGVGGEDTTRLERIAGYVMTPLNVFILYRLFQPESSQWFNHILRRQANLLRDVPLSDREVRGLWYQPKSLRNPVEGTPGDERIER